MSRELNLFSQPAVIPGISPQFFRPKKTSLIIFFLKRNNQTFLFTCTIEVGQVSINLKENAVTHAGRSNKQKICGVSSS
jgi:hypothetical protein